MLAGAALGVVTAVVLGIGSSFGAEPVPMGWIKDQTGIDRYYGEDGQMWIDKVTPDGYYVDGTGAWVPDMFDVSKFTTIPADAKSLMVVEGHGTAARIAFYVKEEIDGAGTSKAAGSGSTGPGGQTVTEAAGSGGQTATEAAGPGGSSAQAGFRWKKLTDSGGYVGRNGIGKEREGDERTPRGLYTLDEAFGTKPGQADFAVPYLQVDDGYYWVGDNASPYYNTMVDIRKTGNVFDTAASEHLSTIGGKAYHYCMAVGYNKEQTPYKGSAIFLHCTDGPGTAGCIAIPEADMVTVLKNLARPAYILIDDGEKLKEY